MVDHPDVLDASLTRLGPTRAGTQLGGVFLPAVPGVRAEVSVAGVPLPVEWGLVSPAIAESFPDVPGAGCARFRASCPPELSGRAVLTVPDRAGTGREVAGCPMPPGPGRRLSVATVRSRTEELADGSAPEEGENRRLHRSLVATPVSRT